MKIGISEKEFMHMTLGEVKRAVLAAQENAKDSMKKIEYQSWLIGYFNQYSIAAVMSKKTQYPENPLNKVEYIEDESELSEDEKIHYQNEFIKRLQRMEERFNKEKEKEKEQEKQKGT